MTLSNTTTLSEAGRTSWDAIVIGAGPAGAVAARQIALQNRKVLLVERKAFPRYKVCGCCLNQRALTLLNEIGLADLLSETDAVPLNSFQLRYNGRAATIPLPGGRAISRELFDSRLVESAIQAGVDFLSETSAILKPTSESESTRSVELSQQTHASVAASARIILAADGLGHPSLQQTNEFKTIVAEDSRLGIGASLDCPDPSAYPPGVIHMALHSGGYVGLVRVEDGSVNLAAAVDRDYIKQSGSPAQAVLNIIEAAGFPAFSELSTGAFKGTIPFTRKMPTPVGERVFVLGDAAGYLEPFTGEGMANAIADAVAVAQLVPRALVRWDESLERDWLKTHYRQTEGRLFWCRWLASLLRNPHAVRIGMRLFHLFPAMARPIVARLNH